MEIRIRTLKSDVVWTIYRLRHSNDLTERALKTKNKSFKQKLFRSLAKRLGLEEMLHTKNNAPENSMLYAVFLQGLPRISLAPNSRVFRLNLPEAPFAFNPSILKTERGWISIVRDTNLIVVSDGEKYVYTSLPHKTDNYALQLDANFNIQKSSRINFDALHIDEAKNGLEDIRLIDIAGTKYGIGAGVNITGQSNQGKITQILFSMNEDGNIQTVNVLNSPFNMDIEKNWMPFTHNSMLHFVYSANPLIIFKFDGHALTPVSQVDTRRAVDHSQFRYSGSTNGIPFRGGHLFIVHSRRLYGAKMSYVHYFMFLCENLELLQISEPFLFERPGIEFAINMIAVGDDVVISYGLADRRSRLVRISADHIADMVSLG